MNPRAPLSLYALALRFTARLGRLGVFLMLVLAAGVGVGRAATIDGTLKMEVIAGPNFVVDSNVESPSTNGPSAAHIGVKITNTGTTTLTNVQVNIGQLTTPATSTGTPGVFPKSAAPIAATTYSGTQFSLQMPGGAVDAVRTIPSIAPGATVVQYFFVTYPLKDAAGKSVTGAAAKTSDDLVLNYDIWATAVNASSTTLRVDKNSKVTMRNEISAMANKIWPNTTSKVPSQYLDAIQQLLGWRPGTTDPQTGAVAQLEGIWYDLGNVGAGFDNDGDGLPDRNAWLQPVGDPARFNPLATRLVRAYGILIVKLRDGTEKLIPFDNQLYFTNIPEDNTGAVGLVYYEFVPLAPGLSSQLSPYQEVASGYDNEKFNGDYGTSVGTIAGTPPSATFVKTGSPASIPVDGTGVATYQLTATNTSSTTAIGNPALSLPFVFQDTIPTGMRYVVGSATTASNVIPSGNAVTVNWSIDGGTTWLTTEPTTTPSAVTTIRWTLGSALAPSAVATMQFKAQLLATYVGRTIDNTGIIRLGTTGQIASSTWPTGIIGTNTVGIRVWKDVDRNLAFDSAIDTTIPLITVRLYHDSNASGTFDAADMLYATTVTSSDATAAGNYKFSGVPNGNYYAVVDTADADLPAGYTLPSTATAAIAVTLTGNTNAVTANWPFLSALVVNKTASAGSYSTGELVTYTIDLENYASPVAAKPVPTQTAYATTVVGSRPVPQMDTNSQGAPDGTFSRIDWAQNSDTLTTTANPIFPNPGATGSPLSSTLVFTAYLNTPLIDDSLQIFLDPTGAGTFGNTPNITLSTAQLNAMVGTSAVRTVALPAYTWAQLKLLRVKFGSAKSGVNDGSTLWVDSIGIRATSATTPPAAGTYGGTTISLLPLVDTYDASKLSYVSASVTPSANTVVGTAGTLTWNNLGPLHAGTRNTLTVNFRALTPDTNNNGEPDATTVKNTATSTNPYFVSGLKANDAASEVTVALNPRGTIGDYVWLDANSNGVKEATEVGIQNVLVYLQNGLSALTDATGYYLITNVPNGTYDVTVDTTTLPWASGAYVQTYDPDVGIAVGGDNKSSAVINTTNNSPTGTTGLPDDNILTKDFGYRPTSATVISGRVFQDLNGNGLIDGDDSYLSGITVKLIRDVNGNNNYGDDPVVFTVLTNDVGYYQFNPTVAGNYQIVVTQPGSTIQTLDPDGTRDNVTIKSGVVLNGYYPNNRFAYQPSGTFSIGDSVYFDWNGNGVQDAASGEVGISGIPVGLYFDSNGDGSIDISTDYLIASETTGTGLNDVDGDGAIDPIGFYRFRNLPTRNYIVKVDTNNSQLAGTRQTQDFDSVFDAQAKVNNLASVLTTADFGFQPRGTASIGDTVFLDANGDGIQGSSETGISGVGITLYSDTNNDGVLTVGTDALIGTATTSSTGSYLFSNLSAGRYLVDVDQVAASIPSDSYGNKYRITTADPHSVNLAAGQAYLLADFGFAAGATIGDYVYYDSNANGTQDVGEPGIPGVRVELYLESNHNTLVAFTTTSSGSSTVPNGFYQFTNVAAGTYWVKVNTTTFPGGVVLTQTADPDRDGVPVSAGGTPAADDADSLVIVSLGGRYAGADFGYQSKGTVGDFVWLDTNHNGVQDPGEPGIANVAIDVVNNGNTYRVTTDLDGRWSVGNLTVGTVCTATVLPLNFNAGGPLEGMTATYDFDGGTLSTASVTLTAVPVTNPNAVYLGLDFGYTFSGNFAISGTVLNHDTRRLGTADDVDDFFDDGVDQDAGALDEVEVANFTVYLYTSAGRFLGTTTTNSRGAYSFTGLPAGTYKVIIDTTGTALLNSALQTTTSNSTAGATVTSTSTSVTEQVTITSSSITRLDFAFLSLLNYDYGDLPAYYEMTTLANDGARHLIPASGSAIYLGTTAPDADTNGIPTATATGDDTQGSTDDEDGVTPVNLNNWTAGTVGGGSVQVVVRGNAGTTGWIVGWIDWNHDGTVLDKGDLIINQQVTLPAGTGQTTTTLAINFDIPATVNLTVSANWLSRFRVFTAAPAYPLFSYTGVATDGEVEDFLIERPVNGSIGDFVWIDTNGDHVLDSTEVGFGGLKVTLSGGPTAAPQQTTSNGSQDADGDGIIDPVGYYRFRNLAAGTYTVTVSNLPANYTASYDENGYIATPNVTTVVIGSGEQHLTADFAYAPTLASISGRVLYDGDANSIFSGGDTAALGVKVQLWSDPDGNGNPSDGVQLAETTTDGNGDYSFIRLAPGNYAVVEINPANSTSRTDIDTVNDDRTAVALAGVNVTGRNFLDSTPPLYAISGIVYDDHDPTNDNVINTSQDTVLRGIIVKVYLDRYSDGLVAAGDTALGSAITDAAGAYSFTGLTAGRYVVQVTAPSGAVKDWDADGVLTDGQIGVTLGGSQVLRNFLLDNVSLNSISGFVYKDGGAANVFDDGDTGTGGVVVKLYEDINADGIAQSGELLSSAYTSVAGGYSFTGLPNGSYLVVETNPAGATSVNDTQGPGTDDKIAVTLAGVGSAGNNFLDSGSSVYSISGKVRNDTTPSNGIIDAADPGIPGVTVTLKAADSSVIGTTTTDSLGDYSFANLVAGLYTVTEIDPAGAISRTDIDTVNDNLISVTITTANITGRDFLDATPTLASITGFVYRDGGTAGAFDGGDTGMGGVTVKIYKDLNGDGVAQAGELVASTLTAATGAYSFTGLASANYLIIETNPVGSTSLNDTQGDPADDKIAVTLAGVDRAGNNFLDSTSVYSISGTVRNDMPADGVLNGNEPGIPGVTVQLKNGGGTVISTTTTNSAGAYSFSSLLAGSYTLVEIDPAGATSVADTDASNDNMIAVIINTANITGRDFLDVTPTLAAISGFVYNDGGTAGAFDSLDTGVAGVVMTLYKDLNADGLAQADELIGSTSTTVGGGYSFTGLPTGSYLVLETNPGGATSVNDTQGTLTDDKIAVTLSAAGSAGNNFLDSGVNSFAISGKVRNDTNLANGALDAADPGIPGVTVTLRDAGLNVTGRTTTDSLGNYSFANLTAGTYTVTETDPAGATSVTDIDTVNDNQITATIANANIAGRDFLDASPTLANISGFVYKDGGTLGAFDFNDTGVGRVVVSLYKDVNSDGVAQTGELIGSTYTKTTGSYSFTGLPTGNYLVVETNPPGATSVNDTDGLPDYDRIAVTLSASGSAGNNFLDSGGNLYSISGTVRNDEPSDSVLNGNESGIPGVTVTLKDTLGNVIDSAVTNNAGFYSFQNLPPATYLVVETNPAGATSVTDIDDMSAAIDETDDNTITVTLSNSSVTGRDFLDRVTCPNTWASWQALWPLGAPTNDSDGDGYNNLIEYAFCLPPNTGAEDPYCLGTLGDGTIYMDYTRPPGSGLDVTYYLEYKATLNTASWTSVLLPIEGVNPANPSDVSAVGADHQTMRINDLETVTGLTAGQGFVRLKVVLASPATTAYTAVSGWTESVMGVNCRTYGNPYLQCADFVGTVDANGVLGQSLGLATSAGPVALSSLLANGVAYYVEVVSGDNVGHRFDVTGATATSLTLANDADLYAAAAPFNTLAGPLPDSLAGDRIELRRHWTLRDTFPVTGFTATSSQTTADQIQIFAAGQWTTYWLFSNSGSPKWVTGGDLTDRGGTVIPPGQGVYVNKRTATANTTLLALGYVRANKFARPLRLAENLVAGGFPLDQSAAGRGMSVPEGFFGTLDFTTADQFLLWRGDTTPLSSGYLTHYLVDFGAIKRWARVGDPAVLSRDAETLFLSDRSVFIKRGATSFPNYFMPLPWTP